MNGSISAKQAVFGALVHDVSNCTLCDRMCGSARVLNFSVGNLQAELFFIGEAPGRLGADETHVPFHGDTAGKNFEDLLDFAGLSRNDIFVTNAVLCNPKDSEGNNATPTPLEVLNCRDHLRRQIDLINPKIVVTLGSTALKAVAGIEPHEFTLAESVRTVHDWYGRRLIALYHPGQRAMAHRSFANQRSDYQFVAEEWGRLKRPRKGNSGATRADVLSIARYLLATRGSVSYFELHKLAYLTEYLHVRRNGKRLTQAYFIRQKDGPYCTDLELNRLRRADSAIKVLNDSGRLLLRLGRDETPPLFPSTTGIPAEAKTAADEALHRYGDKSDSELKTAVYLTAPMRFLLRREQSAHINLYNAPIDFLAAS
jgi:uracil-DNA glycosylase family 4